MYTIYNGTKLSQLLLRQTYLRVRAGGNIGCWLDKLAGSLTCGCKSTKFNKLGYASPAPYTDASPLLHLPTILLAALLN